MAVDLSAYAADLAAASGSDLETARQVVEEAASAVRPDLLGRAIRSLRPEPQPQTANPFDALSDAELATLADAVDAELERRSA